MFPEFALPYPLVTATHAPPAVRAAHAIVNPLLAAAGPHRPYREIHITTPCIAHIFDRETGTTSAVPTPRLCAGYLLAAVNQILDETDALLGPGPDLAVTEVDLPDGLSLVVAHGELLTGPGWIADAGGLFVRLYQRPGPSGTGCRITPPPEAAIAFDIPLGLRGAFVRIHSGLVATAPRAPECRRFVREVLATTPPDTRLLIIGDATALPLDERPWSALDLPEIPAPGNFALSSAAQLIAAAGVQAVVFPALEERHLPLLAVAAAVHAPGVLAAVTAADPAEAWSFLDAEPVEGENLRPFLESLLLVEARYPRPQAVVAVAE